MTVWALALAWAGLAAAQADLTGGTFDMTQHGVASGAQTQASVSGGSFTLRDFGRGLGAPAYPLTDGQGSEFMPYPFGFGLYSPLVDNTIAAPRTGLSITIPSGSTAGDYDFVINQKPDVSALQADPAVVRQADALIGASVGPTAAQVPSSAVELNLIPAAGGFQSQLAGDAFLTLPYSDVRNLGLIDNTDPPLRAKTLAIFWLDESRGAWVRVNGSQVDLAAKTVTAPLPHLSVYSLIGVADTTVDLVYAFPVPWAPNSGNPADGTIAGGITFTNLPSEGTIEIYTPSGQRVRSIAIPAGLFPAQLKWDVRADGGADVVSGVYLWRIASGSNQKAGKLMVIR